MAQADTVRSYVVENIPEYRDSMPRKPTVADSIAVLAIWILGAILVAFIIRRYEARQRRKQETFLGKQAPDYLVYHGKSLGFSIGEIQHLLQRHFLYYQNLNEQLKMAFAKRVSAFMARKYFIIRDKEGLKEMPVLTSAAAVQLTFGLEDYLFRSYDNIQIHPTEYENESGQVLAGDIQDKTITVSWNHFLLGYKHTANGVNLGLHEMAYAFYFQQENNQKKDTDGTHSYEVVSNSKLLVGINDMQGKLFTEKAAGNRQQLWAESVELFFEKPYELKRDYQPLYMALQKTLQQNPLNKSNPLSLV